MRCDHAFSPTQTRLRANVRQPAITILFVADIGLPQVSFSLSATVLGLPARCPATAPVGGWRRGRPLSLEALDDRRAAPAHPARPSNSERGGDGVPKKYIVTDFNWVHDDLPAKSPSANCARPASTKCGSIAATTNAHPPCDAQRRPLAQSRQAVGHRADLHLHRLRQARCRRAAEVSITGNGGSSPATCWPQGIARQPQPVAHEQ